MSWNKVKIGDCCEITSSKRIFFSEYVNAGVPFYRSKEIIESSNGQVISEPLFISQEKYDAIKRNFGVPQPGDMLLTSVGTIGVPYIVKEDDYFYFKDGNLTWFRKFGDILASQYLFYWVKSAEGQGVLNNTTIGSSQKALTIASLKELEVPCPPLAVQNRIVEILAGYDALIENTLKQIKLLEEAAQRLYKEWFVDLRFPGYENTPVVDGVPEGWTLTNINAVMTFHRGYDLTKNSMIPGEYPVIGSTSIIGYHNQYKIKGPGIITGRSGSLGEYQLIWEDYWPHNTALYVSDMKAHHVLYLYSMLKTVDFSGLNNGGAIPTLNRNTLSNITVIEASKALQDEYVQIVEPIYSAIRTANKQIKYLQEARNRLLPKLMNGEIEV